MTSADTSTGTHASSVTTSTTSASNTTTPVASNTAAISATSTSQVSVPKTSNPNRAVLSDHETALHLAVKNKHENIVRRLLHAGVNVNSIDKTGWSPLQKAVSYHLEKATDMVQVLLDSGADLTARNDEGMDALCVAARKGVHNVSEQLYKAGAAIDPPGALWSPFLLAAWVGDKNLMALYMGWGADCHAVNHEGWNALHIACRLGHFDLIDFLLTMKRPLSIHSRIKDGRSSLHIAAKYNNLAIARKLVASNIDIHTKSAQNYTALHASAEEGNEDMALFLLQSGSYVNENGKDDWTPLSLAVYHKKTGMVRLLLDKGRANIEAKNTNDWTPLLLAARYGLDDIAELLIERNADARAVSSMKRSPLHLTAWHDHPGVMKLLLKLNINVNAGDNDGWQPLHMAARLGKTYLVRMLLDHGADPNAKFSPGGVSSSPLQQAAELGHEEVVGMIMDAQLKTGKMI